MTKPLKSAGWLNPFRRRPVGTVPDSAEAIRLREIQALAPDEFRDAVLADAIAMTTAVQAHITSLAGAREDDARQ